MPAIKSNESAQEKSVSWKTLDTLRNLLRCQPGDIIEYVDE
ncbi:MAG: helix-turn-helix domain-containing protein [Butyricicoccaceae bacterium]